MKKTSQFVDRIKKVKRLSHDKEVAKLIGLSETALYNHKLRNTVPLKQLYSFCHREGISFDWLLTGEGEVYRKSAPDSQQLEPDTIRPLGTASYAVSAPEGAEYDAEYNNLINSGQMREIIGILLKYTPNQRRDVLKHLADIMKILSK